MFLNLKNYFCFVLFPVVVHEWWLGTAVLFKTMSATAGAASNTMDDSIVVLDDDDEDVVITSVKAGDRPPTFSYAGLNEVYRLVQDAKELAKDSENDMNSLRVEVNKMEVIIDYGNHIVVKK